MIRPFHNLIRVIDATEAYHGEIQLPWGIGENPYRGVIQEVSPLINFYALATAPPFPLQAGDVIYYRHRIKMGDVILVSSTDIIAFETEREIETEQ